MPKRIIDKLLPEKEQDLLEILRYRIFIGLSLGTIVIIVLSQVLSFFVEFNFFQLIVTSSIMGLVIFVLLRIKQGKGTNSAFLIFTIFQNAIIGGLILCTKNGILFSGLWCVLSAIINSIFYEKRGLFLSVSYYFLIIIMAGFFSENYERSFELTRFFQEQNQNFVVPLLLFLVLCSGLIYYVLKEFVLVSETLQENLKERETLLKEIHHRVKNNLQVISGLQSLQSSYIKDERLKSVFSSSKTRIKAMAMVHESLYLNNNLSTIDVREYLNNLTSYLQEIYGKKNIDVSVRTDVQLLNIDTLVTLGLIINEIVSNSFKYAFPNEKGEISICIIKEDKGRHLLKVSDNGTGFDQTLVEQKKDSLGIRLIQRLSRQLKGHVELESSSIGTKYEVSFYPVA